MLKNIKNRYVRSTIENVGYILLFIPVYIIVTISLPFIFIFNIFRTLYKKKSLRHYLIHSLLAYDQVASGIIYSKENLTISSYTYFKCAIDGKKGYCPFMKLIDWLLGKDHCKIAYEWETGMDRFGLNEMAWREDKIKNGG